MSKLNPGVRCVIAAAGAAASLSLTAGAFASVTGTIIMTRRDLVIPATETSVPGLPAATQAAATAAGIRIVWNEPSNANPGFSPNNGAPVIDAGGNVMWVGTMAMASYTDINTLETLFLTGTTSNFSATGQSNNRGVFMSRFDQGYATNAISMVARDGSTSSPVTATAGNAALLGGSSIPLQGIGSNVLNGTNNGPGLAAGVSVAPNGTTLFNSLVAPVGGTNVGASFFTGGLSGYRSTGLHTDGLSGTAGATLNMTASQVVNSIPVNTSGQFAFNAVPTGGDTHTGADPAGQNNSGVWVFSQGSNAKVYRRSDAAPGVTDGSGASQNYVFGASSGNAKINSSGAVMFINSFASTNLPTGAVAPVAAVSGGLFTTVGGSVTKVAQSGTTVGASLPSVSYLDSTSATSTASWLTTLQQPINNSGRLVYEAKFKAGTGTGSGTITANVNDQALMTWAGGAAAPVYQTGTSQVPGASSGTTFSSLFFSTSFNWHVLNNQNRVAFIGAMNTGGTTASGPITSTTNQGLWISDVLNPAGGTLIAQGGMAAPNASGATFSNTGWGNVIMNNSNMVVFSDTLSDGRTGYFAWTPTDGLFDLFFSGDTSLLGSNYPLGSITYNVNSNGDGGVQSLNDNGMFTFFANSSGITGFTTNNVIMVVQVPGPATGVVGLAGLLAISRRRRK